MGEVQDSLCPADFLCSSATMEPKGTHCPGLDQFQGSGPPRGHRTQALLYSSLRNLQLKTVCPLPRGTRSVVLKGPRSQLGTGNSREFVKRWVWKKSSYTVWKSPKPNCVPAVLHVWLRVGGRIWADLVFFNSEKAERFRCEGRDSKQRSASQCQS